jgi:hypothetical protein
MMMIFDDNARVATFWHSQVEPRVHGLVHRGEAWRMTTVAIAGTVILLAALLVSRGVTPVDMDALPAPIKTKTQSAHVVLNTENVNECRVLEYDNRGR